MVDGGTPQGGAESFWQVTAVMFEKIPSFFVGERVRRKKEKRKKEKKNRALSSSVHMASNFPASSSIIFGEGWGKERGKKRDKERKKKKNLLMF